MTRWEYCIVNVEIYREGTGTTRELLSITRPGEHRASVTNPLGLAGLVNELGAEGWELVDVENGTFYLKRPVRSHVSAKAATTAGITTAAGSLEQFAGEKRVKYFEGETLGTEDFTAEQQYLLEKRYLHNRLLHGIGIVSGLGVSIWSDQSTPAVIVEPGVAIDRCGRELVLTSGVSMALSGTEPSLYLTLAYAERETDAVPVRSDASPPAFSRIEEGVAVSVLPTAPAGDEIVLAQLLRDEDRTWRFSPGQ
jgi:hypothetical protein